MARANYCEFFRFNDGSCDVFLEDDHYLYACAEPYSYTLPFTCKEYKRATHGYGYIVSGYAGADHQYLETLEHAPEAYARAIIASEERYTLETMANNYGYARGYVLDCYREALANYEDAHEAFTYVVLCMMEHDL